MSEKLQKIIASAGLCSRRAAEVMIEQGKVTLNGVPARLGDRAEGSDVIAVDGKPVEKVSRHTYIMLNKPRGYVTTMSDEKGRRTVAELVEDVGVRVFPVGRLDMDSEGLLIMTDDGELANRLTHPSHNVVKTYRVWVKGGPLSEAAALLRRPMEIDGHTVGPASVRILKEDGVGGILSVSITEGRNRQVRKMCDNAGLTVLRLKRVSEGGLDLGLLPSGKWRYLSLDEVRVLASRPDRKRTGR